MKKRILTGAVVVMALTGLVGCSSSRTSSTVDDVNHTVVETDIVMEDGRTIHCLMTPNGYAGGLSCDWENAR